MSKDLRILISGSLNYGLTVGDINKQIKQIQKAIRPLKISGQLDGKIKNQLEQLQSRIRRIDSGSVETLNRQLNRVVSPKVQKGTQQLGSNFKKLQTNVGGAAKAVGHMRGELSKLDMLREALVNFAV